MAAGPHGAGGPGAVIDRLLDQADDLAKVDPPHATQLIGEARPLAEAARDHARLGRLHQLQADLATDRGDLAPAMAGYRAARRSWLASGHVTRACWAELGLTRVRIILGDYEAVREEVARIRQRAEAAPAADALDLARINAVVNSQWADAFAGLGEVTQALRHYDLADNLFLAVGDGGGLAAVHVNRGVTYLDLGMAHRAVGELQRAHGWYSEAGWDRALTMVTPFLARALALTGRIAQALELLEQVEAWVVDDPAALALHDLGRAHVLLSSGLHAEGYAAARRAESTFARMDAVELTARATQVSAEALVQLGRVDSAAGEYAVAERLFTACGSRLKRTWSWLGQAELARQRGHRAAAVALCLQVVDAELDPAAVQSVVRAHLIAASASEGHEVAEHLRRADHLAIESGIPELRMLVTLATARVRRDAGEHDVAISMLWRNLEIGRTWMRSTGQIADSPARGVVAETVDELIEALLGRGDRVAVERAWQLANASKAQTLRSMRRRPSPARLTDRDRPVAVVGAIGGVGSRTGEDPWPIPAVPLRPVVEYYVLGPDVVAFVLRDGLVDVRRLPDAAALSRRLVSAWKQECLLLSAAQGDDVGQDTDSASLDGLYDLLLAPLDDLLLDLEEPPVVVGHRHLHAVPFGALLDEGGPWHHELGAPRIRVEPRVSRGAEPSLLIVAVPDEDAPLIREEAASIRALVPATRVLLDQEATRARFVELARDAEMIHFACHGVFRPTNPLYSALRLADGWLTAGDILRHDLGLDGSIVVLSACNSGVGSADAAEPLGLTWACLAAGARCVVAALWPVDDEVTRLLMTHFYEQFVAGYGPKEALRRARRRLAVDHPHPYHWAAFRCFVVTDPQEAQVAALGA